MTFMVSGRPIHGHRCILSARCELFEKMLNGPMKEKELESIDLVGVEYDVFLMLMEYFYTESVKVFKEVPVNRKALLDLLKLADQYLVNNLKLECEMILGNCLDVETACKVLEVADTCRSIVLRKKCIEFIATNFGSIILQEDFINLPKSILKEIFVEVAHRGICIGQGRNVGNNSLDYSSSK